MTVQATFAATVVDEWVRAGVTDAVVAPGSRSTPLALALDARAEVRVHVHLDERSAGFYALGLGLATGQPAVVLTTSGTAAVELHPAVVEAHHAHVPLLACTADRPPELHDVGASQAIDQVHLFGRAVRWFAQPGVPDDAARGTWRSLAARAVAEARGASGAPGPVHLNLAFREPLVGEPDALPPARPGGGPWHSVERAEPAALDISDRVAGRRGIVVAGADAPGPLVVHGIAEALGWPVVADARSGCRVPTRTMVAAFDALLRSPEFAAEHRPEVVLRLGAPLTSRVLNEWLAGDGGGSGARAPAARVARPRPHRGDRHRVGDCGAAGAVASALARRVGGGGAHRPDGHRVGAGRTPRADRARCRTRPARPASRRRHAHGLVLDARA